MFILSILFNLFLLKKFRQNLLIYQFFVKSLAQDLYAPEIFLAERENINAVLIFVNETEAFFTQFIKTVRLKLAQKNNVYVPGPLPRPVWRS